ncbi:MAG: xanthine dehydrogenase family protein molybdopterin-binding subunit [Candidatus Dormibacterales bacterium]
MGEVSGQRGKLIGSRTRRFDAVEKVTGKARYLADLTLPGMLHGALLLSEHAHAYVREIDTREAEEMTGVRAVVTHRDVPDLRFGPVVKDQRLFVKVGEKATHLGDVIAAVAAVTPEVARAALARIKVRYEPLPAVLDAEEALKDGSPLVHPDYASYQGSEAAIRRGNDCGYNELIKGDVALGFADSEVIVEERYVADHSHPAPIEPHGVLATVESDGRVTVWSSTQVPYFARSGVAETLELPMSKVRVIVPSLGGGFGGKCEFGIEAHAVALAQKAGRPVRLILSRSEEFIVPNMTRHGAVVELKTGLKKDGTLVAREARVVLDTGGNAAHGPVISEIATMLAAGPYRIPHLRIVGHAAYTNKISAGSVRAPSGPQICWALEQHTDSLANAVGMDPYEFRLKNAVEEGDTGPTGQLFGRIGLKECLQRAGKLIGWEKRASLPAGEGMGIGIGWWFSASNPSAATLKLSEDGTVTLHTGANENGSGAIQGLLHLVADEMGIPLDDVSVVYQDTDVGAWDGGSSGSQTVFSVGRAIQSAAVDLRAQIFEVAANILEADPTDLELRDGTVGVKGAPTRSVGLADVGAKAFETRGTLIGRGTVAALPMPPDAGASCSGRIMFPAFLAPAFCAHAARVTVDSELGTVIVTEAAAVQEVGRAINPVGIEGQMEGGLIHGMGNALMERSHFVDGRMLNAGFMDYKLVTAADAPRIKTAIVESPSDEGPLGVRGVGEPPVIAITGAIGNAIRAATGATVRAMPMTPDRVLSALHQKAAQ